MKKIYMLLVAALAGHAAISQTYGWMKGLPAGGGTNVYTGFTFDSNNDPVVIGGAEEFGGGAPDGMVFMKFNKTDGTRSLLKKYNGRTNADAYKIHTDASGNIYFFGTFTDYIAFGSDTLFTNDRMYWNKANYIIAKFDAEGNHLWSRNLGRRSFGEEMGSIVDADFVNGELSAMIEFGSDSVFYNKTFVEKLPVAGTFQANHCMVKVDLNDGSLKLFKNIGKYDGSMSKFFTTLPNGDCEFGVIAVPSYYLEVYSIPANGSALTLKHTLPITHRDGFTQHTKDDVLKVKLLNGNYYMLTANSGATGGNVYGSDTVKVLPSAINLKSASLVKLSSTLGFEKAIRFHWREDYPEIRTSNNKVIVATRFSGTMFIEEDSVVCNNNQQAWEVMVLGEDLSISDTFQVNTANSSGGSFSFKEARIDGNGNVYTQFVHNKNMLFNGTVVQAALKSWDHLTVLAKRNGTGGGTGLAQAKNSVRAGVYPNPAAAFVSLDVEVSQVSVSDITGRVVLEAGQSKDIDVSTLPQGVYYISATDGQSRYHARFIKN